MNQTKERASVEDALPNTCTGNYNSTTVLSQQYCDSCGIRITPTEGGLCGKCRDWIAYHRLIKAQQRLWRRL